MSRERVTNADSDQRERVYTAPVNTRKVEAAKSKSDRPESDDDKE